MKKALALCSVATLLLLGAGCRTGTSRDNSRFADLDKTPTVTPSAGFTAVSTNQLDPALLRPGAQLFTLGPGDRLAIEILGHPDSRAETFVGPDGKLYYHLLPGLNVWGLTLEQTRQLLEKELTQYISAPAVGLSLREVNSKNVWLTGRLARPGIYPMSAPMSLLEALALAGGTARAVSVISGLDLADLRHSFVLRQGQFLPVDFYRLLREGDMSQNIMLQPDDFVFVRSALSQEVYVLGSVNAPRAVPYIEGISLVGALTGASGPSRFDWLGGAGSPFAHDALLSHVAIVRGSLTQPKIAVVNAAAIIKGGMPDVPLEPGDIVYVPNSPYRFLKSYLNLVVNTFVATVAANAGTRVVSGSAAGVGVSVPAGPVR